MFWKNEIFREVPIVISTLDHPKCTYALTVLCHQVSNEQIIILATHLKAKSSTDCENIRYAQVQHMLSQVDEVIEHSGIQRCLFLGDFNADPYPVHKNEETIEPLAVRYVLSWRNHFLRSVYDLPVDENSPLYTTAKYRNGVESKHVIDYIFYSHDNIDVWNRLGPIDPSEIQPNSLSLPDLRYPSDHISIVADLLLKFPPVPI